MKDDATGQYFVPVLRIRTPVTGEYRDINLLTEPSPCILASHGEGGIAQPLHPTECRKFSIEEVKRICSFPDDCHLAGSYAQQWARLGNSVPPLMMLHVAKGIQQVLDVHNKR